MGHEIDDLLSSFSYHLSLHVMQFRGSVPASTITACLLSQSIHRGPVCV